MFRADTPNQAAGRFPCRGLPKFNQESIVRITTFALSVLAVCFLAACKESRNGRAAGGVQDDREYGVITAPQQGSRIDQPNISSQLGVTTATVVTADPGSTSVLGNKADAATTDAQSAAAN